MRLIRRRFEVCGEGGGTGVSTPVVDADFALDLIRCLDCVPNYGNDEGYSDRDADCSAGH
jgi:hypothetical protein